MRISFLASVSVVLLLVGSALGQGDKDKGKDKPRPRELHIVAVHVGLKMPTDVGREGKAFVEVNRPGKRVTLVLDAYNEVLWSVSVIEGTELEKIILCGYHKQKVIGHTKDIPVEELYYEAPRKEAQKYLYLGRSMDTLPFRVGIEALSKLTGLDASSYQGTYDVKNSDWLKIDKVQDDGALSADFPKPADAADLPKIRFHGLHYVGQNGVVASLGEFTQKGMEADTFKPLPEGVSRLAYDPEAKKYYGIANHKVCEVDLVKKTVTPLEWDNKVGELSWPSDVTFDTKRKRLLFSTSSGGGSLYAYSPAKKEWSLLVKKWGKDAMVYHPKHDAVYAVVSNPWGEGKKPTITKFNADFAAIQDVELTGAIFPGCLSNGPGVCSTQLIPVDDRLVILGSPGRQSEGGQLSVKAYLFVVDPDSGKSQLAWKQK